MNVSYTVLSRIAVGFAVFTLVAVVWAVVELARSQNPAVLLAVVPLLLVNLLLLAVLNNKKRQEQAQPRPPAR